VNGSRYVVLLVKIIEGSSSHIDLPPVARRRFQITVGKMMAVILVAGCLVGLFILVDRAVQVPVPRRAICTNNLKQIGLALLTRLVVSCLIR